MPAAFRQPLTPLHRIAIAALLVVVVLAQSLGWMHRSLHLTGDSVRQAQRLLHAAPSPAAPERIRGALDDLFGNHADGADCRLFDVLGQPGCTPAAIALPAAVPLAALVVATHADFVRRWATLFDARGPPRSR